MPKKDPHSSPSPPPSHLIVISINSKTLSMYWAFSAVWNSDRKGKVSGTHLQKSLRVLHYTHTSACERRRSVTFMVLQDIFLILKLPLRYGKHIYNTEYSSKLKN